MSCYIATPEEVARAIAEARRLYAEGSDNRIEIDNDACVSRSKEGTWVAAWVWIPAKEAQ